MKKLFSFLFIFILSCNLPIDEIDYEEQLVVFMNLSGGSPISDDTLFINLSHNINEQHEGNETWVSNANVDFIIDPYGDAETISFYEIPELPGRYLSSDILTLIESEKTYRLEIQTDNHSVSSETITPSPISLESIQVEDLWNCEGSTVVHSLNLNIEENDLSTVNNALSTENYELLTFDTVTYKEADCYTSSFTSMPYFALEWTSENSPEMLRRTTIALEDSWENAIVDTSFSATIFKGEMMMDDEGNRLWPNPTTWNFSRNEWYLGWLSFYYYGLNMIIIEATDNAFANYYAGDALQSNQYIMPNSNIEGGLGLFSSTNPSYFFIYIKPDNDTEF